MSNDYPSYNVTPVHGATLKVASLTVSASVVPVAPGLAFSTPEKVVLIGQPIVTESVHTTSGIVCNLSDHVTLYGENTYLLQMLAHKLDASKRWTDALVGVEIPLVVTRTGGQAKGFPMVVYDEDDLLVSSDDYEELKSMAAAGQMPDASEEMASLGKQASVQLSMLRRDITLFGNVDVGAIQSQLNPVTETGAEVFGDEPVDYAALLAAMEAGKDKKGNRNSKRRGIAPRLNMRATASNNDDEDIKNLV